MLALVAARQGQGTGTGATELVGLVQRQHIDLAAGGIARIQHDVAQVSAVLLSRYVDAGRGGSREAQAFLGSTVTAVAAAVTIECGLQLFPVFADLVHCRFPGGNGLILGVLHFAGNQRQTIGERGLDRLAEATGLLLRAGIGTTTLAGHLVLLGLFLLGARQCTGNREGTALARALRTERQIVDQPRTLAAVVQAIRQIIRTPALIVANQGVDVGVDDIDRNTRSNADVFGSSDGAGGAPETQLMLCIDIYGVGSHIGAAVNRAMHGAVHNADDDRAVTGDARPLTRRRADRDDQFVLQRLHIDGFGSQAAVGADPRDGLVIRNLNVDPGTNRTTLPAGNTEQRIEVPRDGQLLKLIVGGHLQRSRPLPPESAQCLPTRFQRCRTVQFGQHCGQQARPGGIVGGGSGQIDVVSGPGQGIDAVLQYRQRAGHAELVSLASRIGILGRNLADNGLPTLTKQFQVGIDLPERTPAVQPQQPDGLIKARAHADSAGGHLSPVTNDCVGLLIELGIDGSDAQRHRGAVGTAIIAFCGSIDRTFGGVMQIFLLLPGLDGQVATDVDNRCTATIAQYRLDAVVGQGYVNCRGQTELAVSCRLGAALFLGLGLHAKKVLEAITEVVGNRFGYLLIGLFLELVQITRLGGTGRDGDRGNLLVDHIGCIDIQITRAVQVGAELGIGIAVIKRYANRGAAGCALATGLETDAGLKFLLGQGEHVDIPVNRQVGAVGNHGTGCDITHRHAEPKTHGLECTAFAIDAVFCSSGDRQAVVTVRDYRQVPPNIERSARVHYDLGQARNLAVGSIEAEGNFLAEYRNAPGGAVYRALGGCPGGQIVTGVDIGCGANIDDSVGLGDVGRQVRHQQGQFGKVGRCFQKGVGVCRSGVGLDRIGQSIEHIGPGFCLAPAIVGSQLGDVVLEVVLAEQHAENVARNLGPRVSGDGDITSGDSAVNINPRTGFGVPGHLPVQPVGIQGNVAGVVTGSVSGVQHSVLTDDDFGFAQICG